MVQFRFWLDDDYGIIRQRSAPGLLWHPELWREGKWQTGSAYLMDAITGGSDDGWWGAPSAKVLSEQEAAEYAKGHKIDLFADNPDSPHRGTELSIGSACGDQ